MLCPHCLYKYDLPDELVQKLLEPMVRNKLSRRDNQTYICHACGLAEVWADVAMVKGTVTDRDARQRVQSRLEDLQKAHMVVCADDPFLDYVEQQVLLARRRKGVWQV